MSGRLYDFVPGWSEAVGSSAFEHHVWKPDEPFKRIRDGLSFGTNQYRSAALRVLSRQWAALHQTIDHHQRQEFAADGGPDKGQCRTAGMCLCWPVGRAKRQVVARMAQALKKVCPQSSTRRQELSVGEYFVCFLAQKLPQDLVGAQQVTIDSLLLGVPVCESRWLHTGAQKLSPWRTTFQNMEVEAVVIEERPLVLQRAILRGTGAMQTEYEAASQLDLTPRWCLVIYKVDWSSKPVGSFVPDRVECACLEDLGGGNVCSHLV